MKMRKKAKSGGICSMNRALRLPAAFDLALDMYWDVFSEQKRSNRYRLGRFAFTYKAFVHVKIGENAKKGKKRAYLQHD